MHAVLFIGSDLQTCAQKPQHTLVVGGLDLATRALRTFDRIGVTDALIFAPSISIEVLQDQNERDPHPHLSTQWIAHDDHYKNATHTLLRHCDLLPTEGWLVSADRMITTGLFESTIRTQVSDSHHLSLCSVHDGVTDTGLFWYQGNLASILTEAHSIAELTRHTTNTYQPSKVVWAVVQAHTDLNEAQRRLTHTLRKPLSRNADGLTAYWINRPISLRMSKYLVNTPITPNHVTTIGLIMGLLAAWCVAQEGWLLLAVGGLLLQVSSIVDGVDGEIARMRLTSSHLGEWFDTICDDIINLSSLTALGYRCAAMTHLPFYLPLTRWGVVFTLCVVILIYIDLLKKGVASHDSIEWEFEGKEGLINGLLSGFALIAKRDTYTLLIMLLVCANLPLIAFWIMWVGAVIVAIGGLFHVLPQLLSKNTTSKSAT